MERLVVRLRLLWCIAIGWSLISLIAFRSSEPHGPDMVGREVTGFAVPLLVALAIAGVLLIISRTGTSPDRRRWSKMLPATMVIGAAEVFAYSALVAR